MTTKTHRTFRKNRCQLRFADGRRCALPAQSPRATASATRMLTPRTAAFAPPISNRELASPYGAPIPRRKKSTASLAKTPHRFSRRHHFPQPIPRLEPPLFRAPPVQPPSRRRTLPTDPRDPDWIFRILPSSTTKTKMTMPNSFHLQRTAKGLRLKIFDSLLTPAFPTLAHPNFLTRFVFYRFQEK